MRKKCVITVMGRIDEFGRATGFTFDGSFPWIVTDEPEPTARILYGGYTYEELYEMARQADEKRASG